MINFINFSLVLLNVVAQMDENSHLGFAVTDQPACLWIVGSNQGSYRLSLYLEAGQLCAPKQS